MKYVLDTNVLSALMKGDRHAVDRLRAANKDEVGVPHPALAEIAYGIARLARSRRQDTLQERFDLLRMELPRVEWSDEVSESFGSVKALLEKKGERIEDFDAAIAAHALARGAVLVTANVKHMVRIPGLVTEDWSAPPGG
jgi:tRNA(fMet)-specific endonuclease VapC